MTQTVNGALASAQLGVVAVREYVIRARPGWEHDPWLELDRPAAFDAIVSALRAFKTLGGGTIVEAGGTLCGRDPEMLEKLASASGVNIIASTGLAGEEATPAHFQHSRIEAADLADLMADELTTGMAARGMRRSSVRAGAVVTANGPDGIPDIGERALRAAALAARRAGVPVFTSGSAQARRQLELLTLEGLPMECIVIGHCDDRKAADLRRDMEIVGMGACVAYDHVGWEDGSAPHALSDERRAELVKGMVDAGFANRVVLACSAIGCALGMAASKHATSHLLGSFVPRLSKAGIGESALHTMLVENPRRLFAAEPGR
ncbi:MAG: hypothetical protein HY017_21795 [Betaproteobacteria bacterium]|nr:hypothetical protein [Betaproteobacteria bacterium]